MRSQPQRQGDPHECCALDVFDTRVFQIRSATMSPRYKSGEYLEFALHQRAQPGDDVVVQLKNGVTFVRHLLSASDERYDFQAVCDGQHSSVWRAAVVSLFPIIGHYQQVSAVADLMKAPTNDLSNPPTTGVDDE